MTMLRDRMTMLRNRRPSWEDASSSCSAASGLARNVRPRWESATESSHSDDDWEPSSTSSHSEEDNDSAGVNSDSTSDNDKDMEPLDATHEFIKYAVSLLSKRQIFSNHFTTLMYLAGNAGLEKCENYGV